MHKRSLFLFVLSISFCSCSGGSPIDSKIESGSDIPEESYVSGAIAFDKYLKTAQEVPDNIVINGEEITYLNKKTVNNRFCYSFDESIDLPLINHSLYFADINNDGFDEVCYIHQYYNSAEFRTRTIIYDYKNAAVLFDQTSSPTYQDYVFFSLEDGVFIKNTAHPYQPTTDADDLYIRKVVQEKKTRFIKGDNGVVLEKTELLDFNPISMDVELIKSDVPKFANLVPFTKDQTTGVKQFKIDRESHYFVLVTLYFEGSLSLNTKYIGDCFTFESTNSPILKYHSSGDSFNYLIDYYYEFDALNEGDNTIKVSLNNSKLEQTISISYL
ncbi:MAG: hypothetical protein MJ238_01515 [Bacilli bacterium]|nr:hypothetical protein [Bacilli bacterium]